jgi:hypothetical protein
MREMEFLFDKFEPPVGEQKSSLPNGDARSWCDPSRHTEVVGIDFGSGRANLHLLREGRDIVGVLFKDFTSVVKSLPHGCLAVCDDAHLGRPQTSRSLAQPFAAGQLREIYDTFATMNSLLRLFPHQNSRKAREWAANHCEDGLVDSDKTTDINDARALAFYVGHNNSIALRKPPSNFDRGDVREYGALVREASNIVLNAARVRGYSGEVFPSIATVARKLLNRVGEVRGFVNNEKVAFTIAALTMTEIEGVPFRFTFNGKQIGSKAFLTHVVMSSSCHYRGGVARSNLMWHRFRAFFSDIASAAGEPVKVGRKFVPFGSFTDEQELQRRMAMKAFRKQIKEAYRVAVELAGEFEGHEILNAAVCTDTMT